MRLNSGVIHMETLTRCSYSKFLKAVIFCGVLFFFAMSLMCLWLAATDSTTSAALAIFLAMAAGFGGMGWFGLRLLPFLHSSCAATPEGLQIFDRHLKETFTPWSSISRVEDWPALQVVDIYDLRGKRMLSVDYYISNFEPFYSQVVANSPTSA